MTNQEFADPRFNLPPDLTDPVVQAIEDARAEEARQRAEEAANNPKSNMSAEQPPASAETWSPAASTSPSGPMSAVAGKLGIGEAGDAELAKRLLDSAQPPNDARGTASAKRADGARDRIAGALGVGGATPAVER
ncbi:hypothetical protein OHA18_36545 [Kribbella sp. NBC_00709]|uniref:hypothetical protein n=1 Tax=Kribbella sp. NBC_00709 TaxID=2975972 RepID=UPI002E2C3F9E|nr:hypothetical protein [Kribbella sp. NBC_00709]